MTVVITELKAVYALFMSEAGGQTCACRLHTTVYGSQWNCKSLSVVHNTYPDKDCGWAMFNQEGNN